MGKTDFLQGPAGAGADREAVHDQSAGRGDHEIGPVTGQQGPGDNRAGGVAGAEEQDGGPFRQAGRQPVDVGVQPLLDPSGADDELDDDELVVSVDEVAGSTVDVVVADVEVPVEDVEAVVELDPVAAVVEEIESEVGLAEPDAEVAAVVVVDLAGGRAVA